MQLRLIKLLSNSTIQTRIHRYWTDHIFRTAKTLCQRSALDFKHTTILPKTNKPKGLQISNSVMKETKKKKLG